MYFHRRTMIPCSYPFVLMLYLTGMQCVPRFRQRFAALNAAASASSRVAQFTAAAHTPAHPGSIFIACVCVPMRSTVHVTVHGVCVCQRVVHSGEVHVTQYNMSHSIHGIHIAKMSSVAV